MRIVRFTWGGSIVEVSMDGGKIEELLEECITVQEVLKLLSGMSELRPSMPYGDLRRFGATKEGLPRDMMADVEVIPPPFRMNDI